MSQQIKVCRRKKIVWHKQLFIPGLAMQSIYPKNLILVDFVIREHHDNENLSASYFLILHKEFIIATCLEVK